MSFNIALYHLKVQNYEYSFNEIQPAIKRNPGNCKLYILAGFVCIKIAQQTENQFYSNLAVENFLDAFELNNSAQNEHNYLQAKKFVYFLAQKINFAKKEKLIAYLDQKNITARKYLRQFYPDFSLEIPKYLICTITLVFLTGHFSGSNSNTGCNLL